ncbi:hypothetical protein AVEN_166665-1 [Araneus ventricosus]|uniref:Uncharacterized protein n=1 Tax=Araneus ventricosus TaxID=182803 RepID=A0A4Y2JML0_ARAVE|nr:hypothetical protein AVEN_166665-1 [Araneus ventricosus]
MIKVFEQRKEFEGFENLDEENLENWFQNDACWPGFRYLTDEDIVTNCVVISNTDGSTDAEDVLNEGYTVSHSAALQSVETLLDYMVQRGFDYGDITAVRKICVDIRQEMNK